MRIKIVTVICLIIFGTFLTMLVKSKTLDIEKEIMMLSKEQIELNEKIKHEKLEQGYLSSPEKIKKLADQYLSKDYLQLDKSKIIYLNEK